MCKLTTDKVIPGVPDGSDEFQATTSTAGATKKPMALGYAVQGLSAMSSPSSMQPPPPQQQQEGGGMMGSQAWVTPPQVQQPQRTGSTLRFNPMSGQYEQAPL